MACIRRIKIRKTQLVEREFLILALEDLGFSWEEGTKLGVQGPRLDIKLRGHDAGFRKSGSSYDYVHRRSSLNLDEIIQRYTYHVTRSKLQKQGFELASEEIDENGQIHLVLRRMT
jgi:hypothetical protein